MDFLLDRPDGVTVRELRNMLGRVPETKEDGTPAKVFLTCGNLQTSQLKIATLDEDDDLLLIPEFWEAVMEDLGSWEDFVE